MTQYETHLFISTPLPGRLSERIKRGKAKTGIAAFTAYRFVPHLTFYLCRFPERNWESLKMGLEQVKSPILRTTVGRPRVGVSASRTYLYLPLSGRGIVRLHERILRIANGYRKSLLRSVDKERLRMDLYGRSERRSISRYGYGIAGETYFPHSTIGPVDNPSTALLRELTKNLNTVVGESFDIRSLDVRLQQYDVSKKKYQDKHSPKYSFQLKLG